MYLQSLLSLLPFVASVAAISRIVEERRIINIYKQQQPQERALAQAEPQNLHKRQDVTQLLSLASIAGITALPTDPAVLLQLGPIAQQLAAALPTSPVLSVLQTAAPKSFISNIVNDAAFASSFQADFSAGRSPDWFTALPSSVKSYLHTYTGFGALVTDAAAFRSASTLTNGRTNSGSAGSAQTGSGSRSGSAAASTTGGDASGTESSATMTSATGSSSETATTSDPASAAGATLTSSSSSAGAAQQTAAVGLGVAGVLGILGLAVAL